MASLSQGGGGTLSTCMNDPDDEGNSRGARFLLQSSNFKVFTKAVGALAKLGEVLFVEPAEEGLAIRAQNRCQTAYGVFLFNTQFFSEVDTSQLDPGKNNTCRLSMKGALTAFKAAHFSDRNFVACDIRIDPDADFIKMEMQMVHDVRRLYHVNTMERKPPPRRTRDKTKFANAVACAAESLLSIINQMHSKADELIIHAQRDKLHLKNYLVQEEGRKKEIKSEATLERQRFSRFVVRRETEIAFSAKEFKALIQFASQHSASISLYFDQPSQPLIAAIESDLNYTAEFLLSTVETDYSTLEGTVAATLSAVEQQRNSTNGADMATASGSGRQGSREPNESRREKDGYDSFEDDVLTPTQRREEQREAEVENRGSGSGGTQGRTQPQERESSAREASEQQEPWTDQPPPGDFENQMDDFNEVGGVVGYDAAVPIDLPPTPPHAEAPMEQEADVLPASPSPPPTKRDRRFRKFFMSSHDATQHASQQSQRMTQNQNYWVDETMKE